MDVCGGFSAKSVLFSEERDEVEDKRKEKIVKNYKGKGKTINEKKRKRNLSIFNHRLLYFMLSLCYDVLLLHYTPYLISELCKKQHFLYDFMARFILEKQII